MFEFKYINKKGYFLIITDLMNLSSDEDIAEYLGISDEDYIKILEKWGAVNISNTSDFTIYFFKNKKNIQSLLDSNELDSLLIMKKLTEN